MSALLPAVPLLPLLAALVASTVRDVRLARAAALIAPLPALLLWAASSDASYWHHPDVFTGVHLIADPTARLLAPVSGLIWLSVVLLRWQSVDGWVWLCLTMAGNLTVLVAGDVVTFYTAFAVMSFAACGLVVERRDAPAFAALRIYTALVVIGELLLFAGLIEASAQGYTFESLAPVGTAGSVAILAAFAIKCGLWPLHAALPVTYGAASGPVAVALAAAMLNAGFNGWLRLLPAMNMVDAAWQALLSLGVAGMLVGCALGMLQTGRRALLAYSTVCQAGLLAAALATVAASGTTAQLDGVAYYVTHHALAKGALMTLAAVGLVTLTGVPRVLAWAALVLAGLSLAGSPLTGGYIAKQQLLSATGLADWIGYLSAATTALLVTRFAVLGARTTDADLTPPLVTLGVALLLSGLTLALPALTGVERSSWGSLGSAAVVLGAVALAALVMSRGMDRRWPRCPPGDLAVLLDQALQRRTATTDEPHAKAAESGGRLQRWARAMDRRFATIEAQLERWPLVVALLCSAVVVMLLGNIA